MRILLVGDMYIYIYIYIHIYIYIYIYIFVPSPSPLNSMTYHHHLIMSCRQHGYP